MKKNSLLLMITLLQCTSYLPAQLVNGFSNIQSQNPRKKASRIQASDERVTEEIGTPVTLAAIKTFITLTQNYIAQLKTQDKANLTEDILKIAVKAVTDLKNAYNQLANKDANVATIIEELEKDIRSSFSIGRLHYVLDDVTLQIS